MKDECELKWVTEVREWENGEDLWNMKNKWKTMFNDEDDGKMMSWVRNVPLMGEDEKHLNNYVVFSATDA